MKYATLLLLSGLGIAAPGERVVAQPQIELTQTVNGPAALSSAAVPSYLVEYTITAVNNGDAAGSYDLVITPNPPQTTFGGGGDAGFRLVAIAADLAYLPGNDNQFATPMANAGDIGASFTLLSGETLDAGKTEAWTLGVTYSFMIDLAAAEGRGRNEGGDFLQAVIDTRLCSDSNPVPGTGFYNVVSGSSTETVLTDNDSCTDIPPENIDLALSVEGPAVQNGYGNYNVVYTLTAHNSGAGPGFYDVVNNYAPGPGIAPVMAFLSFTGSTEQTGVVANAPAVPDDPAPLNQGGQWVAGELMLPGETETWRIVVAYTVDPSLTTAAGSDCDTGNTGGPDTGFNNVIGQSATDSNGANDSACTPLAFPPEPQADIQIQLRRVGRTQANTNRTVDVVFQVDVTNHGAAAGLYDLVSFQQPPGAFPLLRATLEYAPGGDGQGGTPTLSGPLDFSAAKLVDVPFREVNCTLQAGVLICIGGSRYYTLVTAEPLAAGASESWTIRARYDIAAALTASNPDELTQLVCMEIRGSIRVADPDNKSYLLVEDHDDNQACIDHIGAAPVPAFSGRLLPPVALLVLALGLVNLARHGRNRADLQSHHEFRQG